MVKSSVTLVSSCPSGLAYNVRWPQEVAHRVIRVFLASNIGDSGRLPGNEYFGIYELGRLWWEGDRSLEVKLPVETLVGTRTKRCRAPGPGGLGGPGQGARYCAAGNGEPQVPQNRGRGGQSVVKPGYVCAVGSGRGQEWEGVGAVSKWWGAGLL